MPNSWSEGAGKLLIQYQQNSSLLHRGMVDLSTLKRDFSLLRDRLGHTQDYL